MGVQLLRPIDICDVCDGQFPLLPLTDTIKTLRFKKIYLGTPNNYARVHHGTCYEIWSAQNREAV